MAEKLCSLRKKGGGSDEGYVINGIKYAQSSYMFVSLDITGIVPKFLCYVRGDRSVINVYKYNEDTSEFEWYDGNYNNGAYVPRISGNTVTVGYTVYNTGCTAILFYE